MKYTFKPIPHEETQQLSQLMRDYLSGHAALSAFYKYTPDLKGLNQAITEMQWPLELRRTLTSAMQAQAARTNNTSELTLENIAALAEPSTYTITTGHQLCVFSGPVFFIYKIASVIHACKQLQVLHPDKKFIPVFWMASEDHDLPEANHFFTNEKRYRWNTQQTGALGRMSTEGLSELADELSNDWQATSYDEWLKALFKAAYEQHAQLADATRYLVNALFGKEGVVVFDGDDATLKQLLVTVMEKDLFEQVPFQSVEATVAELEKAGYPAQVKPRPSNFFLLRANQRVRIDKVADGFVLQDGLENFSAEQMRDLIHDHPEQLSPNVVLRPIYQQLVLPNIAYVGGPGELAYWLEFKNMFEQLRVHFPVLVPRAFMTVVPERVEARMNKMQLRLADGFKKPSDLLVRLQKAAGTQISLAEDETDSARLFERLKEIATRTDATLVPHIEARAVHFNKTLKSIENKLNKAIRRKMETEQNWLQQMHACYLPGETPQERQLNFSVFVREYGPKWLNTIVEHADPLLNAHVFVVVGN
jgi:bacillithiol biosynthesis cysteine-adding enzyme BshC